ncbi:serine/threonine protein kinase [Paenibacillus sp. SGZ-1009]|uniref:serine/threonine protein kinase n=1 Tax=Paenibacillus campi TaxID=3106031 RepID=UPI002AFEAA6F|nr:protein kinase [Paenibacillus sp. SGZ-1009]
MRALQRAKGHMTRWLQERYYTPGTIIQQRYRIVGALGSGSYGVTYRCEDVLNNNQIVVLKRVHPLRGGDERARLIYERECSAMSALQHPHMPALLDRFLYRRQHCLVMQYMEGRSIGELLFQQQMVWNEAQSLQLMLQLLELVEFMHGRDRVHRDISLSNVLLHEGDVQLIDFGLTWHRSEPSELVHTLDELVSGDEQEKIIRRSLHVSSDFYSMGHLLLYLLYSGYDEAAGARRQLPIAATEQIPLHTPGWESELVLHPDTRLLLRRLLQVDQPYTDVAEVRRALEHVVGAMRVH